MTIPPENIHQVLDYILPYIQEHHATAEPPARNTKRPFILALTGLQGSGKSTWTTALVQALNEQHKLRTINLSLDDLYLDHEDLVQLRNDNASNKLLQTRGQPGTHDTALAVTFFDGLAKTADDTLIPVFDKSKFNGEGARAPKQTWPRVPAGEVVDVVVFEGWCVGFQPLDEQAIQKKQEDALKITAESEYPVVTLGDHKLEHLVQANTSLRHYCDWFMGPQHLDFLVHLDTDDLVNVYQWRIQQEHALHAIKNEGMTDEQVVDFVRGYMPAYELYLDQLRDGFFGLDKTARKGQLRVVLDRDRTVVNTVLYR
jgi:D-glycerate 3-kinase